VPEKSALLLTGHKIALGVRRDDNIFDEADLSEAVSRLAAAQMP
jgi:hypothetical protein